MAIRLAWWAIVVGLKAGLELRKGIDIILLSGIVLSMQTTITLQNGQSGAGDFQMHDIFTVTKDCNETSLGSPMTLIITW